MKKQSASKELSGKEREAEVVRVDEIYSLAEFMRRTGIGVWGMREARKAGLKTIKVGTRKFVKGADWITFLDQQAVRRQQAVGA